MKVCRFLIVVVLVSINSLSFSANDIISQNDVPTDHSSMTQQSITRQTQAKQQALIASHPIMVKADDPVARITLDDNPTTGYNWFLLSYDHQLVTPVSAKYQAPQDKSLMGASGSMEWTFKLSHDAFVVPQVTQVVLTYARPWEVTSPTKKIITLVTMPS